MNKLSCGAVRGVKFFEFFHNNSMPEVQIRAGRVHTEFYADGFAGFG